MFCLVDTLLSVIYLVHPCLGFSFESIGVIFVFISLALFENHSKIQKHLEKKRQGCERWICMTSWIRDPESGRLRRSESEPDLVPEIEPQLNLGEMAQERTLSDIFYPPRTAFPSCFVVPVLPPNVTFELKPHYT